MHQRPQPADDREFFFFFFCPTFCYRIRSGGARAHARAATYGYALWSSERFVARKCGTPYPSCARYRVGSPHTPHNQHVYGGGTHSPILPGVIRLVGSPGTWIYAKCALRISHSGCWLATEEVDYCAGEWIRAGGSETCCAQSPSSTVTHFPLSTPQHPSSRPITDGPYTWIRSLFTQLAQLVRANPSGAVHMGPDRDLIQSSWSRR